MAEFKAGDRVVKMSGAAAGKYGTVNSVRDDGTLNVTFDGERLPRYCDPERCGQVATNAVEFTNPNYRPEAGMRFLDENFSMFDPKYAKAMIEDARRKGVKVPPGVLEKARRAGLIANSRAANAGFKIGDRVIIKEWAKQKTAGYGRGTIIRKVGAKFLVRPDEQSHEKYYVPTYVWNEDDLVAANAARNAVALPSDSIRSESDLARAFANKGWKLIMEGNRWTLRDDKGMVRWQDSFGGDAESYDRVFRRFASYLNLR